MSSFTLREQIVAGGILAASILAGGLLAGGLLAASLLAVFMAAAPTAPAAAQQKAAAPDFSSNGVGWVGLNGGGPFFEPVPGRLPPVASDPAHPFVPNGVGKQPTFRIADLTDP